LWLLHNIYCCYKLINCYKFASTTSFFYCLTYLRLLLSFGIWKLYIHAIVFLFQEGTSTFFVFVNSLDIDTLNFGDRWEGDFLVLILSLPGPLGHWGCLPWNSIIILLNKKGFHIKVTMIGHPLVTPIFSHFPWALGKYRLRDNKVNSIFFIFLHHILWNCACISNNFS
jgi:hypothetical protein